METLQKLQGKETLRAANKLTREHTQFGCHIMKVRLAAWTPSSSVSKALDFTRLLGLADFKDTKGTAKCIADVDQ